MRTLTSIFLLLVICSCSNSSQKLNQLEARQDELELKIDSIKKDLETMSSTDSILIEMVSKPEAGSLLSEIE